MEKVTRLKEECPWCGKKTLGQDESGFISCVKCEYDSDIGSKKYEIDVGLRCNKSMDIYDALVCCASNDSVNFTCICDKLKGHKGKHKSSTFPEYPWENETQK